MPENKDGNIKMLNFTSRRVLVTGGSRGIGAEIKKSFSRHGASVAFTYLSSEDEALVLAKETGAFAIRADVANEEDTKRAVGEATALLGGAIDILVLNAGISISGLMTDLSLEEWNRLFSVNVTGAFLYSRATVPDMVRQHYGRIVTVSSIWGMVGASCEVAYSSTKAALLGFTKALAKELGPSGITVNAVAPGVILTSMMDCYSEEDRQALADETPMCRLGTPKDVASAVLYLASDDASFVTGQVLSPGGGIAIV